MKVKAIVHPAEEGGYWAEVPALPGCITEGDTWEELMANLKDAIEGWLEVAHNSQPLEDTAQDEDSWANWRRIALDSHPPSAWPTNLTLAITLAPPEIGLLKSL